MKPQSYCIQWINSRGQTHTGPELWKHEHFTGDFTDDIFTNKRTFKTNPGRPKTLEEAQALATNMNSNPEFNNQSHQWLLVKHTHQGRLMRPTTTGELLRFIF